MTAGDVTSRPAGDARPAASSRRAFWTAFALLLTVFSVWLVGNPPTAAPDEPAHATKAAGVVRGQLVGDPVPGEPDGFGEVQVPHVVWHLQNMPFCYYFQPSEPADCLPPEPDDPERTVDAVTTASNYNPLYYAPVGVPTLVPGLNVDLLYLMRLVSAVLCALTLAWAVRVVAELRAPSWPVLGLLAATTPMVVFLASTVSPAGLEICTAIALWVGLLALTRDPDPTRLPRRMAGVAVVASVLVNLRGMSPFFLALIVVTVVAASPWARTWTVLRDRRSWPWLGVTAVASGAALVWIATAGSLPQARVAFPELTFVAVAKHSVLATPTYLRNMVGQFGWVDTDLPEWLVAALLAVVVALVVAALVRGTTRERVVILALGAVTFAAPVVIHASQAQYIGVVWQGRYFLPVAVGLPLLAAFVLRGGSDAAADAAPSAGSERPGTGPGVRRATGLHTLSPRLLLAVAAGLLAAQAYAFATNLHRYTAGVGEPWFVADVWQPPVHGVALLVLLVAVLAAALVGVRRITAPDARARTVPVRSRAGRS